MHLLLSMPGGLEWIFVVVMSTLSFGGAIWLLVRFLKNRDLKKELDQSNRERDELKNEII